MNAPLPPQAVRKPLPSIVVEKLKAAEKKYFKSAHGYKRVMRRQKDEHYGKICQFFDTKERRCGIYLARPSTCRIFPGEGAAATEAALKRD